MVDSGSTRRRRGRRARARGARRDRRRRQRRLRPRDQRSASAQVERRRGGGGQPRRGAAGRLARPAGRELRRARTPGRLWAPPCSCPTAAARTTSSPAPTGGRGAAARARALAAAAAAAGARGRAVAIGAAAAVSWAVGCCLVARHRHAAPARALRRADLPLRRGPGAGPAARARRASRPWFWPQARVRTRAHATRRGLFGGEPLELLARQRRAVVHEQPRRARAARSTTGSRRSRSPAGWALKALLRRPRERERAPAARRCAACGREPAAL